MKKLPASELLCLACIHAEADLSSRIDAGYVNAESLARDTELLEQIREYRRKRWGREAAPEPLTKDRTTPPPPQPGIA